jgi:hypothetical protein
VIKGGVYNFQKIIIPGDVSIYARGSNPLTFTATEDVLIAGIIDISGHDGVSEIAFDSGIIPLPGGLGGPAAGRGGMGHPAYPTNFTSVALLQSPPKGEDGFGHMNLYYTGGRGGETGASEGVPWQGTEPHKKSRGAGGGGGSNLLRGNRGMVGKGTYSPGPDGNKVVSDPPLGGGPGDEVFTDENPDNNFYGEQGEIAGLRGGQGGGGAGTRWDSLNPDCKSATLPGWPDCMWDSKGGGGGGGGGALAIHTLGNITITKTGRILAQGGLGGVGEQLGAGNFGGGGGGGGGGAVILHAGQKIILEEDSNPNALGAVIDVSGGRFGDCKELVSMVSNGPGDPCPIDDDPPLQYCSLSVADGGQGGFGIVQLMVDDPENDLSPPPWEIQKACEENRIRVGATVYIPDWNNLSKVNKPFYDRVFHTYETDPSAYPKIYAFWSPPDPPPPEEDLLVMNDPPLADPYKTAATLTPVSYGLSKWIDLGAAVSRPPVSTNPWIPAPAFLGFQGTDPATGVVLTENGYVKDHSKPGYNDIEVDAPDLGLSDYIAEDNEVTVEFQGAGAKAPGLSQPGDDKTDWTGDITALSGYQFIRFRVKLNVSKSNNLTVGSTRPQVNKIRIRVQY